MVCNILEIMIRTAGASADHLDLSSFTRTLLTGLHGSWSAHCTTGPLAKDAPVDGIVETDYFAVLARLIMASLGSFRQAVGDDDTTMTWLLEEWFSHFENIGDPARRKLMCLALTTLLGTNQPFILRSLQSLMTMWTDVITELREGAEDVGSDSLVYAPDVVSDAPSSEDPEAPEDGRRRRWTYSDEVYTINLPEFVRSKLQRAIAACGASFEQEWLGNVDKEVVASFSQLGIM